MTTAPRREPTLHQALVSLREADFSENVHLFAEPGTFDHLSRPTDPCTIVHDNLVKHGCFGNWSQALRRLLSKTDAPWLLIVQDDAIWLPASAPILRAQLGVCQESRTGFISTYVTPKDAIEAAFVAGWNECRIGWTFWGALAFCLQREAAVDLLQHPRFAEHRGTQQVDAVVAESMLDLERPSFVHVPSLVDHIGATSSIGNDDIAGSLRGYRFGER